MPLQPSWFARARAHLKSVQRAPEAKRRRWLTITSAVTMVFILLTWVLYLNLTLPRLEEVTATSSAPAASASGDGFWETFGRGLSQVGGEVSARWNELKTKVGEATEQLKGALERPNEFSLEVPTTSTEPAPALEPIPPTRLP